MAHPMASVIGSLLVIGLVHFHVSKFNLLHEPCHKRDWHGRHLGKARWKEKELANQKVERAIKAAQVIGVP